jgi:hypothetical protein
MHQDFSGLDPETLKTMYLKEEKELRSRLLNGALWHDLREQRKKLTELSIALHRKNQSTEGMNPAEHSSDDIEVR